MKQIINRLLIVLFFVLGVALIPFDNAKATTGYFPVTGDFISFSAGSSQYYYNGSMSTLANYFNSNPYYDRAIGVEVKKTATSSYADIGIRNITYGTDEYWGYYPNAPTTIGFYNATANFTLYDWVVYDGWYTGDPTWSQTAQFEAINTTSLTSSYKVVNQPPTISTPSASTVTQTSATLGTTFNYNNNVPGLATYNAALGTWNNIAGVTQTGICYTTTGSSSYSIAIVGTSTATISGGTCIKNPTAQAYPYPTTSYSAPISGLTPGTTYYAYGYVQYSTFYLPAVEGGNTYTATAIAKSNQGTFTTTGGAITVTVTADSPSVNYNGGTWIHWFSTGATSCAVTSPASYVGKIGTTGISGNFTASPLISPTEFIVTCSN